MSGNCRNFSINRRRIFRARDDVDDADRFFPTPQRTGNTDVNHAVDCFQILDHLIRRVPRVMKMQTTLGFLHRSLRVGSAGAARSLVQSLSAFRRRPASAAALSSATEADACLVKLFDLFDTQSGHR